MGSKLEKITDIPGVQIEVPSVHYDNRGSLYTLWREGDYDMVFNHDKVSISHPGVLRGVHGDEKSYKLITCLSGELFFVVVDNRLDSPTYMKWCSTYLPDNPPTQVLLPPGVGNGFYVLGDTPAVFHYKWSYEGEYPDVEQQFTIKWNDDNLGIDWPNDNPILSKRDKK